MAGGYGLQFQPGVAENGNGAGDKARGRVQEPVQVLSTRLPKIFGAQSIAPAALLQGAGGMGMAGAQGNVVAQALAQLAGLPPTMSPSAISMGRGVPPPGAPIPEMARMGPGFVGGGLIPGLPPPPYNPPPPVVRPGDERPPFPMPMPIPGPQPPPVRELIPEPQPRIGGRPRLPGTIGRDDGAAGNLNDPNIVHLLARGLFR